MPIIEHTPGPWAYDEETGRIYYADDDVEPSIAFVDLENTSPEQAKSDGHLLAAAPKLLAACRMVAARWEHGDLAEAARTCSDAIALAEADVTIIATKDGVAVGIEPSPPGNPLAEKPYSVLLLYPDYANDGGSETYYAFVTAAADPLEAVARAQRQASAAQEGVEIEPDDFQPLLVTQGHHHGEPLFNK